MNVIKASDKNLKIFEKNVLFGTPKMLSFMYTFANSHGASQFISSEEITKNDYGVYSNPKNSIAKLGISEYSLKNPYNKEDLKIRQYVSTYSPEMVLKIKGTPVNVLKRLFDGENVFGTEEDVWRVGSVIDANGNILYKKSRSSSSISNKPYKTGFSTSNTFESKGSANNFRMSQGDDSDYQNYQVTNLEEAGAIFLNQAPALITEIELPFSVPSAIIYQGAKGFMKKFNEVPIEQFNKDKKLHMFVNEGVDDMVGFLMASPVVLEKIYEMLKKDKHMVINFTGNRIFISTLLNVGAAFPNDSKVYEKYAEIFENMFDFAMTSAPILYRSTRPSKSYPEDAEIFLEAWRKTGNNTLIKIIVGMVGIMVVIGIVSTLIMPLITTILQNMFF